MLLASTAACARAQALELGPKVLPLKIVGVVIEIPVSASILVQSEQGAPLIRVAAAGDLKALQDHALQIARGLALPHDNCARNGPNVVVDSIDTASIAPQNDAVVISLSGHVTVWACAKLLGQKVKTPAASDVITVSVPIGLEVPNKNQIRLKLSGTPTITARGALAGDFTQAFIGDVNARLSAQLGKALDTDPVRAMIPSLPGVDVSIENARFVQEQSSIAVQAKASARMSDAALNSMLKFMTH